MGIFKKKRDNFVANVTRAAVGHFIQRRDGTKIATETISDTTLEGMPEAVAAMMIFSYSKYKYSNPSITNAEAMIQVLIDRGHSEKDITMLLEKNDSSIFRLINDTIKYLEPEDGYLFMRKELESFVRNITREAHAPAMFTEVDIH